MNGISLIILILALILLFSGLYFLAWYFCEVQRSNKKGHYILEDEDLEQYNHPEKKLYTGLDMVDESKDSYVKNTLDLDNYEVTKTSYEVTKTSTTYREEREEVRESSEPSAPEDKSDKSSNHDEEHDPLDEKA